MSKLRCVYWVCCHAFETQLCAVPLRDPGSGCKIAAQTRFILGICQARNDTFPLMYRRALFAKVLSTQSSIKNGPGTPSVGVQEHVYFHRITQQHGGDPEKDSGPIAHLWDERQISTSTRIQQSGVHALLQEFRERAKTGVFREVVSWFRGRSQMGFGSGCEVAEHSGAGCGHHPAGGGQVTVQFNTPVPSAAHAHQQGSGRGEVSGGPQGRSHRVRVLKNERQPAYEGKYIHTFIVTVTYDM